MIRTLKSTALRSSSVTTLFKRYYQTVRTDPSPLYAHASTDGSKISFSTDPNAVHLGTVSTDVTQGFKPDQFSTNKQFLALLHDTLKSHVHECSTYGPLAQSEGVKANHFGIYDLRSPPPQARIAEVEDTIGHVRLDDGKIELDSYEPNDFYRLVTTNGFLVLSDDMHKLLKQACEKN